MVKYSFEKSRALILRIFRTLDEEKIPYVVLRNYEGLPDTIGHDIDLLVSEDFSDRCSELLLVITRREGWFITQ